MTQELQNIIISLGKRVKNLSMVWQDQETGEYTFFQNGCGDPDSVLAAREEIVKRFGWMGITACQPNMRVDGHGVSPGGYFKVG